MAQPPHHPDYQLQPQNPGQPSVMPGTIELNVQGNILVSNMVPPTITIDGHKIAGVHVHKPVPVPVPPGRRHIEAHSQWMRKYGQASLEVDVRPGEVIQVFYAPPMHQFTSGRMGTTKQPIKGKAFFIVVMAILLLVLVITIAGIIL